MSVDIITRTVVSFALAAGVGAIQQAPPAKPVDPKPVTSQSSSAATKVGSIDLTVTSLTGAVLADAKVSADGPSTRQGSTSPEGELVLTNITPGTYRCRIQRDGFFTLEKEIIVRAGARTTTEATLSPAPPPPPPPAPTVAAPKTVAPTLVAGSPATVSLVDQIADDLIKSKDPIAEHALGCSGATSSKVIRLNDALPAQTHADADEIIYLIAGSATLTMNGKDQAVSAGWFSLIPRGMSHALKPKGGKPVLVLSIQSGPPCANSAAPSGK